MSQLLHPKFQLLPNTYDLLDYYPWMDAMLDDIFEKLAKCPSVNTSFICDWVAVLSSSDILFSFATFDYDTSKEYLQPDDLCGVIVLSEQFVLCTELYYLQSREKPSSGPDNPLYGLLAHEMIHLLPTEIDRAELKEHYSQEEQQDIIHDEKFIQICSELEALCGCSVLTQDFGVDWGYAPLMTMVESWRDSTYTYSKLFDKFDDINRSILTQFE